MSLESVSPATVPVWRLRALGTAVVLAGAPVGVALTLLPGSPGPLLALACLGWSLLVVGLAWWLPGAWFRHLGYRLDPHGLVIRQGIFWRHRIAIPRVRIQHSDVSQGPLQRRYGVATLKLYTAGSRFTCNELPGLDHDTALTLRDTLLRQDDGDDGDAV